MNKEHIINKEIFCLANALGEKLLNEFYEGSEYVIDIHNEYDPIHIDDDGESQPKEIFQYFIVSDWFGKKAIKNNQYIIETEDLYIWGRETCGISLAHTDELDFLLK